MARKANIVSFDDAKNASRRRAAEEASEGFSSVHARSGYVYYDLSLFADPASSRNADARLQRASGTNVAGGSSRAGSRSRRSGSSSRSRSRTAPNQALEQSGARRLSAQALQAEQPRRAQAVQTRSAARTKTRANKLFDRQYGGNDAPADVVDAPRAALYETKMGSSHRRSARMQRASEAGPVSAKINPAGWFSNIKVSPKRLKLATAVLCVVLSVVFLYAPAQQYYQSVREQDRLQAEFASIEERNAAIVAENASLASDAGMEDAVRQKYGYVKAGEQVAVVAGLSDQATAEGDPSETVEANVLSSSVKAPEEWYTPYLDAFFGVS